MLTDTFIKTVKVADKPKKYADGGGLFLFVPLTGSKLWRMSYRFEGKNKLLSFGEYPIVSLKMARERRDAAKRLLTEGVDPSEHKKAVKMAQKVEAKNSFGTIAREWYETMTVHNSPADRHRKIYTLEKFIFPTLGHIPITRIETSDILAIVKPLELRLLETAYRVTHYCGMIFRYAIATNRAKYNVVANLRGALRPQRPVHRASITNPNKVGMLLLDIDNYHGQFHTKCALQFLSLVFVRASELRNAIWEEIDFDDMLWRIPAERMKMRAPHLVPLSTQAVVILKKLQMLSDNSPFVFPSVKKKHLSMSSGTMLAALRYMGYDKEKMCVHGFRSMASTILNELGFNRDWIERQLAHQERSKVRAAYNYAEYLSQRRTMMQSWADHLDELKAKIKPKYNKIVE